MVDRHLVPEPFANLLLGFEDYIKRGGPQKDIEAYHKTESYKKRQELMKKLFEDFQKFKQGK